MNTIENKILSEQCKETVLDFFIIRKQYNKKNYARVYFEKLLTQKEKYKDKMWDEENTVVNYLLSHKDFNLTNTSLNELFKLNKDWSSPNSEGENSIFFLIRKEDQILKIKSMIDKYKIEYNQKNQKGLYFVNDYMKEKNINHIIQQALDGINNFPEIRIRNYFIKYIELIEYFPNQFKDTVAVELNKFENIKKSLTTPEVKKFNNNAIGIKIEDEIAKVEKYLAYLSLDSKLIEKEIKSKKLKI